MIDMLITFDLFDAIKTNPGLLINNRLDRSWCNFRQLSITLTNNVTYKIRNVCKYQYISRLYSESLFIL